MQTSHYSFVVVPDDEEPEYNKFFAYLEDDYDTIMYQGGYGHPGPYNEYPTRGAGDTPTEAIACLCALLHEEAADRDTPDEHLPWATAEAAEAFIGGGPTPPDEKKNWKYYKDHGLDVCPYCHTTNIELVERNYNGTADDVVMCNRCGERWFDVKKIVGIERINNG